MVTIIKRSYTPRYDFSIRERVKRYLKRHPGASTNKCAKALRLQWHTVKRYREKLAV